MRKAWVCLKKKDLLQASDKGWKAGVFALRGYAEERNMEHSLQGCFSDVIEKLSEETRCSKCYDYYSSVLLREYNFDGDKVSADRVKYDLKKIKKLREKVNECISKEF